MELGKSVLSVSINKFLVTPLKNDMTIFLHIGTCKVLFIYKSEFLSVVLRSLVCRKTHFYKIESVFLKRGFKSVFCRQMGPYFEFLK